MPTIVTEDGSNVSGANSYVDPLGAFAVAYFDGSLYASAWTAATDDTKKSATIMATRTLDDAVNWYGMVSNDDQALRWPRLGMIKEHLPIDDDVIPDDIKKATLELASQLISRDRTNPEAASAETKKIVLGKGAVELEFTAGTSTASANVPVLPDAVWRMVRYYGTAVGARGSRIVEVVR